VSRLSGIRRRLQGWFGGSPSGVAPASDTANVDATRRIASAGVLVLVLIAVGLACWLGRWSTASAHGSGDTFWYTRMALTFAGEPRSDATVKAAQFVVDLGRGTDPGSWIKLAETIDPRYPAIFEARPLYPLVASLFVPSLGVNAMIAAALLGGVAFAVALGLSVRLMTGSAAAAVAAVVVAYILPSGGWLAFLYADGWMFAVWTAAIGLAIAHAVAGSRTSFAGFIAALAVLLETKSANGLVLVAALCALAILAHAGRWETHARVRHLAIAGLAIAGCQAIVGWLVGAPGLDVTLQDYFTRHFSISDVQDPLRLLLRRDLSIMPRLVVGWLTSPLPVLCAAAGLAALAWLRSTGSMVWLTAAAATLLTVLIHPQASEFPRLLAPVWISVAVGFVVVAMTTKRRIAAKSGPAQIPRSDQ
jgi:hypothetical protein